jgi:hypothetical protein
VFTPTNVRADTTVTTEWNVQAWIAHNTVRGVLTMTTTGIVVVGHFLDYEITGRLLNKGTEFDGKWSATRGSGWITLHFHTGGYAFNGKWGRTDMAPDGQLVGSRIVASPKRTPTYKSSGSQNVQASITASASCVPNVKMSKTTFLSCVKPYPDEYWVGRQHGVPHRIDQKNASQYDWVYVRVNGSEEKFTFGPGGRVQSMPTSKPSPKPAPSTLF